MPRLAVRRLIAILNPRADRGRTAGLAQSLQDALGGRFQWELRQTTKRREAIELARNAGEAGCDAVLAIGGDGTVHEVMNGLMQLPADRRPALGIVPAGSGNDVAFAMGIRNDLVQSAEMVRRGATRPVDVGEIRTASGAECYCLNNVGLLLEGEINRVSHRLQWPRGSGLYIRAMLQTLMRRLPVATLRLAIDGQEQMRRAMILSLANGPRSGGRFQLMPEATLDDGQFDYVLAPPVGRLKLLWNVRHALAGRKVEGDWIERGRFSQMSICSDTPLVAHVDGEPWLATSDDVRELSITVLPAALRVIAADALSSAGA